MKALLPFSRLPIILFVILNLYAIKVGSGRWTAKSNLDAVSALQSSLQLLRQLTTVAIYWVPAVEQMVSLDHYCQIKPP
jgi:hypothetical protein